MKKIIIFLMIAVIILIIAFIGACVLVSLKGKAVVTQKLEEILDRQVEIGNISAKFPLDLKIENLNIENLLKVDEIHISFGAVDLLRKNISLPGLKLLRPELIIQRTKTSKGLFSANFLKQRSDFSDCRNCAFASSGDAEGSSSVNILINKLVIKNGKVRFIDKTLGAKVFQLDLININVKASKLSFPPQPFDMKFDLDGDIVIGSEEVSNSKIKAEGWINLARKDMLATVKVNNLDGTYLHPYYQKFSSKKLKSADINFQSDLNAKNNELTADCYLEINNLAFEKVAGEELESIGIFDIISGGFSDKSRDINLDFTIRTKLDNPKIDSAQIRGIVIDKIFEETITQSVEQITGGSSDISGQVEEIGKELKNVFKGIFER